MSTHVHAQGVCVRVYVCVPTPILLCKHADLAQHRRHFEVGSNHCNLPASLTHSISPHTLSQRPDLTLATLCGLACGH